MDQYRMIERKDFIAFLSGFVFFIKKVARYILISIRDCFKVFSITLLIILAVGLWRWSKAQVYYESEMVCTFKDATKKTYGEMLHRLDMLAKDGSYTTLAGVLHLPVEQAKTIISVEGKNMVGSMLYEDITTVKEPIYISVKATDNLVFASLQPALLTYLNTGSPYIDAERLRDSSDAAGGVQWFSSNIALTDSIINKTRKKLTKRKAAKSAIALARLLAEKDSLENQLVAQQRKVKELGTSVDVLHGFIPSEYPVHERDKDLKLTIAAAIIVACMASVLAKTLHDIKVFNEKGTAV